MSESNILPEDPVVNLAAAEVEETVTQSMPDYHEDEDAELQKTISMSLENPDAETTEDTMGDSMPIDEEEEIELDLALFLSKLPPDMFDEQLAELHQGRVNVANSDQEAFLDLVISAMQLLMCREPDAASKIPGVMHQVVELAPIGSGLKASLFQCLSDIETKTEVEELHSSALQLMKHFQQSGDLTAIDNAVQLMEEVVKLTPDGHTEKASRLGELGNALQRRFQHLSRLEDLENLIFVNQQAVNLTPDGHALKAVLLNNLGCTFFCRFKHLDELEDVENAILVNQQAVDLVPDGHADKSAWLNNLGNAFLGRFEHLGELRDIENAILVTQQAVDLAPDGHTNKAAWLNNLGRAFFGRFEHLGELKDIENAVLVNKQAVDLTPDGHALKATLLNDLGHTFLCRFDRLGKLGDIENAVIVNQQLVDLTPDGHADKARRLGNLGFAFLRRFNYLGKLGDLENAVLVSQQAVDLTPDGHANKAKRLNNLGNALSCRFQCLGKLGDMENAILVHQQADDLTPDGHADKATQLNDLGNVFQGRFKHLGELRDIEKAIFVKQQAVDLTPDGHALKATLLTNLGNAFFERFQHLGNLRDIENAILVNQQAIALTPDGHGLKATLLENLGSAFIYRFDHFGKLGDIENAILVHQQAVDLTHDDHTRKAARLAHLGLAFQGRFEHFGEPGDIENAILVNQQAVDLTPDGHAGKAELLHDLGKAFSHRFHQLGKLSDIENAILVYQQAVDLTPDGHTAEATRLSSLGLAFKSRFGHLRELRDIENAILVTQKAVDLTPDGHASKAGLLNNLGNAFSYRFEHLGELRDMENAILVTQQAVDLIPNGHARRAALLANLGNAFSRRYKCLGQLGDIENAISTKQKAVDLTSDDHVDKAVQLHDLGSFFLSRFDHLGKIGDIENAILFYRQAIDLTPDGHADKATRLINLGRAFQSRFECLGELGDIAQAIVAFKQATENTSSPPLARYVAASAWALSCSIYQSPSSALDAYTVVLDMIPQVVWFGQTVQRRYDDLPTIGMVINTAATLAISVGDLPRAVEWLEEGRSIVWKQILQLRTPLDELHQQHPDLADELSRVSLALDNAGTSDFQNINLKIKYKSVEEEAQNHRKLAAKYEELLQQVRKLDGFSRFLKPKTFPELSPAARNGPVVVVNAAALRCDALVLCTSGEIIPVPLPTFSCDQAETLHLKLLSALQAHGVRVNRDDVAMRSAEEANQDIFISVLADLWSHVVQPILSEIEQVLHENAHVSLPHITWCATGPLAFLPLHAAGIYRSDNPMNIADFAVSSYTTTLTAMLGSSSKRDPTVTRSVLIVSQPATPGLTPLPGTVEEVEVIQCYASPDHTCHLTHESATDMENPLNSAFALYDGRLNLSTLMKLSLENAELAVLSACETATGDERLPEEAVHLAAGMLAVGYPSVIATMWSIGDTDAPLIADKVYANLLGCRENSESQKASLTPAYALHAAVKHLREEIALCTESMPTNFLPVRVFFFPPFPITAHLTFQSQPVAAPPTLPSADRTGSNLWCFGHLFYFPVVPHVRLTSRIVQVIAKSVVLSL
ncbi:hypothetical protein K435DRAFT_969185 [Dendrothele bispora CBS 962.96]|uniref:CHAT domain-containing protein n=1 Tax=Dendrothele bispora (strain CBS 962.96) TaxID=1314807 RepID=A0A4S8LK50_DENBC|nr:hypothetical protein K435DRAFT_969185 [Dendrothele bispora CBS 962.96]